MRIELHPQDGWIYSQDGHQVLHFFCREGEYQTERGERLGRPWDEAKAKAEALAKERLSKPRRRRP